MNSTQNNFNELSNSNYKAKMGKASIAEINYANSPTEINKHSIRNPSRFSN